MTERKTVTAQVLGDPPAGRSALDGYVHIGQNMSHRLYGEKEYQKRKYQNKKNSDALARAAMMAEKERPMFEDGTNPIIDERF